MTECCAVVAEDVYRFIDGVAQTIERCVDAMPPHQAFIDRYCAATPEEREARGS